MENSTGKTVTTFIRSYQLNVNTALVILLRLSKSTLAVGLQGRNLRHGVLFCREVGLAELLISLLSVPIIPWLCHFLFFVENFDITQDP